MVFFRRTSGKIYSPPQAPQNFAQSKGEHTWEHAAGVDIFAESAHGPGQTACIEGQQRSDPGACTLDSLTVAILAQGTTHGPMRSRRPFCLWFDSCSALAIHLWVATALVSFQLAAQSIERERFPHTTPHPHNLKTMCRGSVQEINWQSERYVNTTTSPQCHDGD